MPLLAAHAGASCPAQVTFVAAPWLVVLRWLSWAAGLQLSLLSSLGVAPAGFVPQAKVRRSSDPACNHHARPRFREGILSDCCCPDHAVSLRPGQVRELNGVVAHMHLREDQYRRVGRGRALASCAVGLKKFTIIILQ